MGADVPETTPRQITDEAQDEARVSSRQDSSSTLCLQASMPASDDSERTSHLMPTLAEDPAEANEITKSNISFKTFANPAKPPRVYKSIRHWKFLLLRLLAIVSPWIVFILLCVGYGSKTITKFSAGISAFLVFIFVSLTKAPRKDIDTTKLGDDLFQFSEQASRAKDSDFKELLASATDEELEALCVLVELALPWNFTEQPKRRSTRSIVKKLSQHTFSLFSRPSESLDSSGSPSPSARTKKSDSTDTVETPATNRSLSNISAGSRKVKFSRGASAKGSKDTVDRRGILKHTTIDSLSSAAFKKPSLNSTDGKLTTLRHTVSDLSVSSLSDFNGRNRGSLQEGPGTQLALELDLPSALSDIKPEGFEQAPSNRHHLRLPGGAGSFVGMESLASLKSGVSNVSALTYHSACDAILGDVSKTAGESGELVSAEIAGVGQGANGMTRVRIEFRSQCLRTQNEWQKSLLRQRDALLNAVNTKLKKTQQELSNVKNWAEDMHEDQKVLLRSFRKIIPRELGDVDGMDEKERIVVIIIDEDKRIRDSSLKMCQDLEYKCLAFKDISEEARETVRNLLSASPRKPPKTSVVSLGSSLRSPAQTSSRNALPLILLGVSALDHIPLEWQDDRFFLALTSQTQDFEDVGRKLLASGESEIRERLRSKGIAEYLFHPLSMNALRGTVREMVRRKLGVEYLLVDTLGRGSFGVVYRAKRLSDGEVFALKEISLRRKDKARMNEARMEPETLRSLSWPTIVRLVDFWQSHKDQVQYLLMPVLLGGNLLQQIETSKKAESVIPSTRCLDWYAQTLHALSYLHWMGVFHRDVKPANFFLSTDCRALQVGDLGSAARLEGSTSQSQDITASEIKNWASDVHARGSTGFLNRRGRDPLGRDTCVKGAVTTVAYSSPEVFKEKVFYASSDLWSLGVSFFQVMTLELPHELPDTADQNPNLVDPDKLGMNAKLVLEQLEDKRSQDEKYCMPGASISAEDVEKDATRTMVNELLQLLHTDPMSRPSANWLTSQAHIKHRVKRFLEMSDYPFKDCFSAPANECNTPVDAHLLSFERLLDESWTAEILCKASRSLKCRSLVEAVHGKTISYTCRICGTAAGVIIEPAQRTRSAVFRM